MVNLKGIMKVTRAFSPVTIVLDTEGDLEMMSRLLQSYRIMEQREYYSWRKYEPSVGAVFAQELYNRLNPTQ